MGSEFSINDDGKKKIYILPFNQKWIEKNGWREWNRKRKRKGNLKYRKVQKRQKEKKITMQQVETE